VTVACATTAGPWCRGWPAPAPHAPAPKTLILLIVSFLF
jgi:hypothetical protein